MMPIRRSQNWLPGIFNDFFTNDWIEKVNVTSPAINVLETETAFKVEVAACGMAKDDFNVRIDEDENLIISMEKMEEKKEEKNPHRYLRREFSYSNFHQTLILPDNADKNNITAQMENGVLHIEIPKLKEDETKKLQKIIEIK
ncbi:MAG: Hsp20/alpha crystallin family protein [Mediterranea sp.]|jgi:HSP20 family protein|nr:Hsp20/alpha crystallin family protein [Mediterranea sp.]